MHIPYEFNLDPKEVYQAQFRSRRKKAVHLAERVKLYLADLEKSTLKDSDKSKIRKEFEFLTTVK